jgi:hypothetical protein
VTGRTRNVRISIQDYVQPATEIEPSVAVNPANPKNVVTVYQEGRIADGGAARERGAAGGGRRSGLGDDLLGLGRRALPQ